jgi:hypothetical protein
MIADPQGKLLVIAGNSSLSLPATADTMAFWDAWAFAAVESDLALEAWLASEGGEQDVAYHVYVASLDREEHAALVLAERVDPAAAARLRACG